MLKKLDIFLSGRNDYELTRDLEKIMKKEPLLTPHGFGPYWQAFNGTGESFESALETQREHLLKDLYSFDCACFTLGLCDKVKSINRRHHTYQLKHRIEENLRCLLKETSIYVSNGATIAAAIYCGFKYKEVGESAVINLSEDHYNSLKLQTFFI